ncbi:MAG: hypothetical protein HZA74_01220 [Ignavibacteriales bacterium]|nr:hypothetical protein [Ignavibacteriales bacterium]
MKDNYSKDIIFAVDDKESYKFLKKLKIKIFFIKSERKSGINIKEKIYKIVKKTWAEQYILHFINLLSRNNISDKIKIKGKTNFVIYDTFNESMIKKLNIYINNQYVNKLFPTNLIVSNKKILKYLPENYNFFFTTNLLKFEFKSLLTNYLLFILRYLFTNRFSTEIRYGSILPKFRIIFYLALSNYEYQTYFEFFKLNKENINIVISNTAVHPRTSLFVDIFNKLNIKYKILAHGYPFAKVGYLPVNNLVVYDDFSEKIFSGWGVQNIEKVKLYNLSEILYDEEYKNDVLICLSPDIAINNKIISFISEFYSNNKLSIRFRLRKHPGTTFFSNYENSLLKNTREFILDLFEDSLVSIYNSKFVVSFYSTVLFESNLLGKPAIAIYDCSYWSHFNINNVYFVNEYSEFKLIMNNLLKEHFNPT